MDLQTVLLVITILCIVANAWASVADFVKADFVLANARELGLSTNFVTIVAGVPKAAATVGLAIGLAGVPWLGFAAATGLVAFFVCAMAVHVYKRVLAKIAIPMVFDLLAIGALVYFAGGTF